MKRISIIIFVPLMLITGCGAPTEQTSTVQESDRHQALTDSVGHSVGEKTVAASEATEATDATESKNLAPVDESAEIVFGDQFPEVIAVKVKHSSGDRWRFDVTLSSTYDSPQRYADGWRVLDAQGNELGVRVLGHDHANEQPFTRSHTIQIPSDHTGAVFLEARDQANGWSGQRYRVKLP